MLERKIAEAKREYKKAKKNLKQKQDELFCLKVEYNQLKKKEES